MELDLQNLNDDLVALRERHQLSQAEFALLFGCSQSKISKLESKGMDLKWSDFCRYLSCLGYQPQIILRKTS